METLDPRLFLNLLHALIRANSSPEEAERSARVLTWLGDNLGTVSRVCERAQKNLVGIIWAHFYTHQAAPSWAVVETEVRKRDKPDGMLFILAEYEATRAEFPLFDALDMPALLESRKQDWERGMMHDVLQTAMNINHGRMGGKKETDKPLSGGRDAVAYILDCLQQGALVEDQRAIGGSVAEDSDHIVYGNYEKAEAEARDGKMIIPTGFASIPGVRRRALTGVLGYAGQRKSALCRTIAYRAAEEGFRGLHIALESSADEEFDIYAVMHSHHAKFRAYRMNLSVDAFYQVRLTAEEKSFLRDVVLPDLKDNLRGDIVVRQPMDRSWPAIKAMIEMENRVAPLDFVYIDYLSLLDKGDGFNSTESMNAIIRDAKAHCLTFDGGRGYALITPVQGNRDGYNKAAANGGAWVKDGIGQYNEFEKSLDLLLYVYQDPELQAANQIKIGTCKNRRSADAPVEIYQVDPASGFVRTIPGYQGYCGQDVDAVAIKSRNRSLLRDSSEPKYAAFDNYAFDIEGAPWTN